MGAIFSRFSGVDESDYEKILSDLDEKIQRAEIRLSDIRIRERRTLIIWLVYSTLAYALYVLGFFVYLSNPYDQWAEWTIKITPVIAGPIVIMLVKSLLNIWYRRKQTNEESELVNLRAHQKLKLEELKKKTAYYSTKSLLERYDSPNSRSASAPPPRDRQSAPQQNGSQQTQSQQARGGPGRQPMQPPYGPGIRPPQQRPGPAGLPPLPPGQMPQNRPPYPSTGYSQNSPPYGSAPTSPPGQKHWYDKLVDVIVGEEGPETKYALICEKCSTHNGLALADEFENVQYTCPKCGHFNPSRRKRRMGGQLGLSASAGQPYQRPNSTPLPLNPSSPPSPSPTFGDPIASLHRGRSVTPRPIEGAEQEDPIRGYTIETRSRSAARQASNAEEEQSADEGEIMGVAGGEEEEGEETVRRRRSARVKRTGNK